MQSKGLKLANLLAVLNAAIIGFSFLFTKVALEYAHPMDTLTYRFAASFLIMSIPVAFGWVKLNYYGKPVFKVLLLATMYPLGFFTLQAFGLQHATSSFLLVSIIQHAAAGTFDRFVAPLANSTFILSILYLGGIASLLTALTANYILSKMEASKMSVFTNLSTIVSLTAGAMFLGEEVRIYHLLGSVMIIGGIIGTHRFGRKRASQHNVQASENVENVLGCKLSRWNFKRMNMQAMLYNFTGGCGPR
ncbi:solute carrier family 35 transporter [Paenibacillus taiwanensis]|uniref:solute carrier family 35 transporter n=1 Tax=Paenibacillus taiwanensis TaxID=401638 RepID=UPI00041AC7B7|nr:DMT family transporter [Paenibacillus taiwanensis]